MCLRDINTSNILYVRTGINTISRVSHKSPIQRPTGNRSHTLTWNTHSGNKLKDLDEFLVPRPRVYDLNEVDMFLVSY